MMPPYGEDPQNSSTYPRLAETTLSRRVPDLVEEIQRKQRRSRLRRRLLVVAAVLAGLAGAGATWSFYDAQARRVRLADAATHVERGTRPALLDALALLEQDDARAANIREAKALISAQLWTEFGIDEDTARERVSALDLDAVDYDGAVAIGLWALTEGELDRAEEALENAQSSGATSSIAPGSHVYLAALLAMARGEPERLAEVRGELQRHLADNPRAVVLRRISIAVAVQSDHREEALAELDAAREQNREHMGLAADEALYNASFRQHVGGVASVAEQLLAAEDRVAPRDLVHANLALAAAETYSGEYKKSLERLQQLWPKLLPSDRIARDLALELAILDGDADVAEKWIDEARLPDVDANLLRAWLRLAHGKVMESLEALADLPQEHPRVAYLQGLALVEQGRYTEAEPWLRRADELLPGQLEIEVALARVELRLGDADAALRKLEGLAEEEALAPRVWTGLGEAYLDVAERRGRDRDLLRAGQRALEQAIERERVPAEAMLALATLHDRNRQRSPESPGKALELLEQAANTNRHLPRYAEHYGRYLAALGYNEQALEQLEPLIDRRGTEPQSVLTAIRVALELGPGPDRPDAKTLDAWFERATELHADPAAILREQARRELADGSRAALTRAQEAMAKRVDQDPKDTEARVLLSQALLRLYERSDAEKTLRRGLQAVPDADRGLLYLQWAAIESRTGARGKAAAHARVAWRLLQDSDAAPALALEAATLASRMFIELDKPIPAFAVGRDVSEAMPYHAAAWILRARAELAAKKATEALEHATKAVAIAPDDAYAHEMLGHCHMRFGHKDEAKAAYEKAVAVAGSEELKKELRENLRRL